MEETPEEEDEAGEEDDAAEGEDDRKMILLPPALVGVMTEGGEVALLMERVLLQPIFCGGKTNGAGRPAAEVAVGTILTKFNGIWSAGVVGRGGGGGGGGDAFLLSDVRVLMMVSLITSRAVLGGFGCC